MTHMNQPTRFRFSLLGLLIFMSVCAVLAATWPKQLPLRGHAFLLGWLVIVLANLLAWWRTRERVRSIPEGEPAYAVEQLHTAHMFATLAMVGPMGTWTLQFLLLASERTSGMNFAVILFYCPLGFFNALSVPFLGLSLLAVCSPRRWPSLFLMQVLGIVQVAMYWWALLLAE